SAEHWELYTYAGSGLLSVYQPGRGCEVKSAVNVCDGQWHALAAVLEPERVRLYVDGKLVKESPATPLKGQPAPGELGIGRLAEGRMGCDGVIDAVGISKGVREISLLLQKPLKRDAQTIEVWDFDQLPAAAPAASPYAPPVPLDANAPQSIVIPAAKPEE